MRIADTKTLAKLCKYIANLSAYDNFNADQPLRVYTDDDGDLLAFEGIIYHIVWVNSRHSLSELAQHIRDAQVMTFSEFRNTVYSMNAV